MAHGGHTGGARSHSHVHHYGGGYGRGGGYDSLGVIMLELIFSIGLCIAAAFLVFNITGADEIGGKKPLEGEYETVQYLHDDDIFSNQEDLIQGLEYLREKTNVQLVIMTTDRKLSYGDAVREYHLTFEDEGHILLIVPQEGSIRFRYAIGADANKVINSEALDYLIKNVRHSRDGEYWKQQLYDFTDELVKND